MIERIEAKEGWPECDIVTTATIGVTAERIVNNEQVEGATTIISYEIYAT